MNKAMVDICKLEIEAMYIKSLLELGLIGALEAAEASLKIEDMATRIAYENLSSFPCPLPDDFPAFTCQWVALQCNAMFSNELRTPI